MKGLSCGSGSLSLHPWDALWLVNADYVKSEDDDGNSSLNFDVGGIKDYSDGDLALERGMLATPASP